MDFCWAEENELGEATEFILVILREQLYSKGLNKNKII